MDRLKKRPIISLPVHNGVFTHRWLKFHKILHCLISMSATKSIARLCFTISIPDESIDSIEYFKLFTRSIEATQNLIDERKCGNHEIEVSKAIDSAIKSVMHELY